MAGCNDRGVPELLLAPDCFTNAMPYTAILRVMPLLYHNSKLRTSFKSTFISIVKARQVQYEGMGDMLKVLVLVLLLLLSYFLMC